MTVETLRNLFSIFVDRHVRSVASERAVCGSYESAVRFALTGIMVRIVPANHPTILRNRKILITVQCNETRLVRLG